MSVLPQDGVHLTDGVGDSVVTLHEEIVDKKVLLPVLLALRCFCLVLKDHRVLF